MKAAVIEADHVLTVTEIPEPEIGDYDALVDILYGATCTGTDLALIAGKLPFRSPLPTVLGHESVGFMDQQIDQRRSDAHDQLSVFRYGQLGMH